MLSLLWILALQSPAPPPVVARTLAQVRAGFSGDRALATTAFVARYWRIPGNTGFNASITRVAAILDSAGFERSDRAGPEDRLTYRIERRPMLRPTWEPVGGSLTIIGKPTPLLRFETNPHMLGMYSASTPPEGVEGEIVSVGNGATADFAKADVAGKIVLGESSLGRLWTEAVRKRGALGVLAYTMPAYTKPEVNRNSIQFGGIPWDSTRAGWGLLLSFSAREALRAAMAAGPVRVRVVTSTRLYPSEELTLIAEVRGSRIPSERFVMSAHVQEPGANDNASGVGAQAEIARVLASLVREGKADPARTLTFIWGDEIAGVRRFLREDSLRSAGVRWGLSLDMVGEDVNRTGGTFLIEKMPDPSSVWTRGEDRHTEWGGTPLSRTQLRPHYFNDFMLNRCRDQSRATGWVVNTNPYEGGSDHIPFLEVGKPGLLFWHFTDQFYHTDGDRIENVSAAELANAGVCALSAALILASADGPTARYIADETRLAAIDRLAREGALSREAIAAGASPAEQKEILQAWAKWYSAALEAIREIEVGGTTATTEARIRSAQRMLAAALERELTRVARR